MKKVRIKKDLMYIHKADNLKAGSIHNVIDTPKGQKQGTWVMGIDNTPIKIFEPEFEFVKE